MCVWGGGGDNYIVHWPFAVTLNEHLSVFPAPSVTLYTTVWIPSSKLDRVPLIPSIDSSWAVSQTPASDAYTSERKSVEYILSVDDIPPRNLHRELMRRKQNKREIKAPDQPYCPLVRKTCIPCIPWDTLRYLNPFGGNIICQCNVDTGDANMKKKKKKKSKIVLSRMFFTPGALSLFLKY